MRPRKAEKEAMSSLLERDHEDVESLASEALSLAWSHLIDRDWWCCIINQPGVAVTAHGPFESVSQAEKYLKNFPAAVKNARPYMFRMHGITTVEVSDD